MEEKEKTWSARELNEEKSSTKMFYSILSNRLIVLILEVSKTFSLELNLSRRRGFTSKTKIC